MSKVPPRLPSSLPNLLKVTEVAGCLRACSKTVYRKIRSGELTAVRVGQQWRVHERDLQAYITGQR